MPTPIVDRPPLTEVIDAMNRFICSPGARLHLHEYARLLANRLYEIHNEGWLQPVGVVEGQDSVTGE